MAAMLLSMALPFAVIAFCAWHQDLVDHRRSVLKLRAICSCKLQDCLPEGEGLRVFCPG